RAGVVASDAPPLRGAGARAHGPVPVLAGDRSGRHGEPGLLDDAVPLHVARRRLAQLAGAARGDGTAAPAARPGPDALGRPGVPAPVSLFAPGLRRALQPPVGAGHVHHRLHGDRDLVRDLRAAAAAGRDPWAAALTSGAGR